MSLFWSAVSLLAIFFILVQIWVLKLIFRALWRAFNPPKARRVEDPWFTPQRVEYIRLLITYGYWVHPWYDLPDALYWRGIVIPEEFVRLNLGEDDSQAVESRENQGALVGKGQCRQEMLRRLCLRPGYGNSIAAERLILDARARFDSLQLYNWGKTLREEHLLNALTTTPVPVSSHYLGAETLQWPENPRMSWEQYRMHFYALLSVFRRNLGACFGKDASSEAENIISFCFGFSSPRDLGYQASQAEKFSYYGRAEKDTPAIILGQGKKPYLYGRFLNYCVHLAACSCLRQANVDQIGAFIASLPEEIGETV